MSFSMVLLKQGFMAFTHIVAGPEAGKPWAVPMELE